MVVATRCATMVHDAIWQYKADVAETALSESLFIQPLAFVKDL